MRHRDRSSVVAQAVSLCYRFLERFAHGWRAAGFTPAVQTAGIKPAARYTHLPTALIALGLVLVIALAVSAVEQRFPPPEFTETRHELPQPATPAHAHPFWEYLDVAVLAAALALSTYLAVVRRSRLGLILLTIGALIWFGFWRKGCICSIGAIQNITLAAFDPSYSIPFTAVVFFTLPILVTIFFGRTFCASVCPLGAVQELVALKPIQVPNWIDQALGLLPFIYLGGAVLFAATGTTFLICSYDPFVGFFRREAPESMFILGGAFLVVGLFVGRPYCRYVCPYGAILGLCSRLSSRHVRIPPEECIQCKLCVESCPYGAIREPTVEMAPEDRVRGRRRLAAMLVLLPILVGAGFALGLGLAFPLARLHPDVRLAEYAKYIHRVEQLSPEAVENPTEFLKPRADAVEAFRKTGQSVTELDKKARRLRQRFGWLGGGLGAWVGLVVGVKLVTLSLRRRRTDYQPDKASCLSCGRCFWYCPPEQVRQGLIVSLPLIPKV